MKKVNPNNGRLHLKRIIIARLNDTHQRRVFGGSVLQQPTVQDSQANCATMSDDCPGPLQVQGQPPLL